MSNSAPKKRGKRVKAIKIAPRLDTADPSTNTAHERRRGSPEKPSPYPNHICHTVFFSNLNKRSDEFSILNRYK